MLPHDADSPLDSPFEPITGSELYTKAHEVFEAGDPLDALRLVDRALELGHVDADICLLKGQILHDLRRYDDALAWFDEAQAFSPRHADVLTWTARVHAARGRHRKALSLYRRVLTDDPFHAEAMPT